MLPGVSCISPLVITVSTVPMISNDATELVGTCRARPLILTIDDRPTPCAVEGEKEL